MYAVGDSGLSVGLSVLAEACVVHAECKTTVSCSSMGLIELC